MLWGDGLTRAVCCELRSWQAATTMNCLVGYGIAQSMLGKHGGASEWCPGHIKFAGMNIDPGACSRLTCLAPRQALAASAQ